MDFTHHHSSPKFDTTLVPLEVLGRATSLEYCPWCTSKGFTFSLRSYRVNFEESIILCTNPQCLFPLVSQPLEDILASLDPVEPTVRNKRKKSVALEKEELTKLPLKRLRSSEAEDLEPQSGTDSPVSPAEQCAVNPVRNGLHATPEADGKQVNRYHEASPDVESTGWASLQKEGVQERGPDRVEHTYNLTPTYSPSVGHLSDILLLTADKDKSAPSPNFDGLDIIEGGLVQKSPPVPESDKLVFVPKQLFWGNSDNLCWLDSLLVALVNCKSLKFKPEDEPQWSTVWQLMKRYEAICTSVQEQQLINKDGVPRVPSHVLHKASADLQSLRMSVFNQLQPKLHCKLGQMETPVFAMPLLLTMDSWVECLFKTTFHWEFKCSECKVITKEK
ncbi:SUMO-specific isopeptidase USPL1 [Melanotaenia boesemani]|uniref:SUMO-specific isopeptidase USPL1 n=1 Tax=Melanotaenia boesemani TaxID=1250792 RepID=UPI001C058AEF|nr:SUMO-specific isopeptidase USPL1 [Melanotaenia boesemani]